MSYNITNLRVKNIFLELPLDFDFQIWLKAQSESAGKEWCEEEYVCINFAKQTWKLPLSGQELSGIIADNKLIATDITCSSEGSGHIYTDIIIPFFVDCKGLFQAIIVWEGGESVESVHIHNGSIESESII